MLLSSGDSFLHLIKKCRSQLGCVTYLLNYLRITVLSKKSFKLLHLFAAAAVVVAAVVACVAAADNAKNNSNNSNSSSDTCNKDTLLTSVRPEELKQSNCTATVLP